MQKRRIIVPVAAGKQRQQQDNQNQGRDDGPDNKVDVGALVNCDTVIALQKCGHRAALVLEREVGSQEQILCSCESSHDLLRSHVIPKVTLHEKDHTRTAVVKGLDSSISNDSGQIR